MNYLIVVAHPDDEVLGAGATIHKLVADGHSVAVCTMAKSRRSKGKHLGNTQRRSGKSHANYGRFQVLCS